MFGSCQLTQGEAQAGNGAAAMNLSNKATQAVRDSAENILAADWLSTLLAGSAKSYAAGFANIPGDIAQLGGASKREQELTALNAQLWGETDPTKRAQIEERINYLNANPGADNAVRKGEYYQTADRLALEAARERAQANKYAPTIVNDVISGGLQMGADVGLGALTGGGTLLPMTVRGYGGASQEARRQGANYGQSVIKGAASALTSYLTEQISGIGTSKITGVEGTLDDAIDNVIAKAVNRFAKTAGGQTALNAALQSISSFLGEGLEEGIEALAQPVIDLITDKDALKQYGTGELYEDAVYEALVGGLVGLLANGVQQAGGQYKSDRAGYEGVDRMLNGTATEQDAINVLQSEAAMRQFERSVGVKPTAFATIEDMLLAALEVGDARETARLKKNNVPYTAEQVRNIKREGKTFKNLIANIDTKVSDFFNKWKNGRKSHQNEKLEKLYIGTLSDSLKPQISSIVGYDVGDRDFIITNDDVRHIFDHHGDAKKEVSRGNLPLDTISFDALLDVVAEPTRVYRGAFEHGKPGDRAGIVFEKKFENGRVVYIQFDNKGRHTLQGKTMYIKPAANTTSVVNASSETNTFTPKTAEPVSTAGANNILHPNVENKGDLGVAQKNIAQNNEFFDWLPDVKNREMPPRRKPDNKFFEWLPGIENSEEKPKDNSHDKNRNSFHSRQ